MIQKVHAISRRGTHKQVGRRGRTGQARSMVRDSEDKCEAKQSVTGGVANVPEGRGGDRGRVGGDVMLG